MRMKTDARAEADDRAKGMTLGELTVWCARAAEHGAAQTDVVHMTGGWRNQVAEVWARAPKEARP